MYIPYLRGRQYELITIREMINNGKLSNKIVPLIEPVKLSSTLMSTIKEALKKEREIIVICNSEIEDFEDDFYSDEKKEEREVFLELLKSEFVIKGFIMNKNIENDIIEYRNNNIVIENEKMAIICNNYDYIDKYQEMFAKDKPKYTFIPENKRFSKKINHNIVLLGDRFKRKDRNSDYLEKDDEFYSDDHLNYRDEGYIGFSDYSTIGEKFVSGGFAPYAVAIHMLYFDEEKDLRVHHFVSDSNLDIKNPAKKFYEALEKLCNFKEKLEKTRALEIFEEYFENQSYPGLGSLKKLSLMHHLELMGKFLDEGVIE